MFKYIKSIFVNQNELIENNKKSAELFQWSPKWFSSVGFNERLIENIKISQRKYGIEETGFVDSSTYRRRLAEMEALDVLVKKTPEQKVKYIICNGENRAIKWDKVLTFKDVGGLELPNTHYKTFLKKRDVNMFVTHWDVCLNSKSCYDVLKKSKLSVHFMIDNDGTIYQLMDTQHAAWHAGNRVVNDKSIGVEISNAYYLKYQRIYEAKGLGKRPIWINDVEHAKEIGEEFLGFYDVQIQALKVLIKTLHFAHNIELQVPLKNNKMVKTMHEEVANGTFRGIVNHYHITKRKIDCAGLKLDEIVEGVAKDV